MLWNAVDRVQLKTESLKKIKVLFVLWQRSLWIWTELQKNSENCSGIYAVGGSQQ